MSRETLHIRTRRGLTDITRQVAYAAQEQAQGAEGLVGAVDSMNTLLPDRK